MFGISREQYYIVNNPKKKVPPVGYYKSSYKAVDKNTPAAAYGLENFDLLKNSLKIKNDDFKTKTHVCARVNRSLGDFRWHQVQEFTKILEK